MRSVVAQEAARAEEAHAREQVMHERHAAMLSKGEILLERLSRAVGRLSAEVKTIYAGLASSAVALGELQALALKLEAHVVRLDVRTTRLEGDDPVTIPETALARARAQAYSSPEIAAQLAALTVSNAEARRVADAAALAAARATESSGQHDLAETQRALEKVEERQRYWIRWAVAGLFALLLAVGMFFLGRNMK